MTMTTTASLFSAIQTGDMAGLHEALAANPELAAARNEQGIPAVLVALYHRRPDMAVEIEDRLKTLSIHEACALGRLDSIEHLLADDVSLVSARSSDGFTPLHLAAFFAQHEAAAKLIAAGAGVDVVADNPTRVRPLHSAVASGKLGGVRLLLEYGADPNSRQQMGFTPLMGAAANGHVEMVRLLLSRGADPSLRSEDGKTAREHAEAKGHPETAALL
jgi:ankyrin repeat protein